MPRKLARRWVDEFIDYLKESEAPANFIYWSAISCLSGSLKRKVYMQHGLERWYANQYIVLVGPPGVGKGRAISPGVHVTKQANTINYLSDRITAEKIVDRLAVGFPTTIPSPSGSGSNVITTESSATIVSKELPNFLSASDWMLGLLCQLWDENEFDYETKNKGSKHISDLCVGLVAGCVPDYIRRLNKDAVTAISGGFTARCVFVYASEKSKKVAWPTIRPQSDLEADLINDLKHIGGLSGEVTWHPRAFKLWEDFYDAHQIDQFEQEVVANFRSRMPSHIIKLAMTLSVAENDSLEISVANLQEAIDQIEEVSKLLSVTFKSTGESSLVASTNKVMEYIQAKGDVSRSEILKAMYRDVTDEDLQRILDTLEKMGVVQMHSVKSRLWYKDLTTAASPNTNAKAQVII